MGGSIVAVAFSGLGGGSRVTGRHAVSGVRWRRVVSRWYWKIEACLVDMGMRYVNAIAYRSCCVEDAGLLKNYANSWCDMLVGMSRTIQTRMTEN